MLYYALVFLVVAIIAGLLGFGVNAFAAAGIAKLLFFIFLILFVVSLIGPFGARPADLSLVATGATPPLFVQQARRLSQ